MLSPENVSLLMKILVNLRDVLLGSIGGLVAYLYDYSTARRSGNDFIFMYSSLCINIVLGAFVAYSIGTFIPTDTTGRDAIVGFSGVSAYSILTIVDGKLAVILDKYFKTKGL